MFMRQQEKKALYDPSFEHDACGIGAVVSIKGIRTNKTVQDALTIVETLEHRAGKDAEGKTGDGVGIMLQISHKFFQKVTRPLGFDIGEEREYGIAMFFFPQDELRRNQAKKMFEIIASKEGIPFLGWRDVPIRKDIIGQKALDKMPFIAQGFVKKPFDVEKGLDFDRRLYIVRRIFEQSNEDTYVCSFSSRTIVYKGMFLVSELRGFYDDLRDPDYESAIALVHSRFSTNTTPSWYRAHPYRLIVHNGEINTIHGNADMMLAREETMSSKALKDDMGKVVPVINATGSDSAELDNTLEFLMMSGVPLPKAVMITIPEPWQNDTSMSQNKRDFYQYYATMLEPWDGPASIVFTDGDMLGAVLDRNGLRPSRYYVTDDDYLILSSEVGALPIPQEHIVLKDRLRPGKMLLVDTQAGRLISDDELKEQYAASQPYGEWVDANLYHLKDLKIPNERVPEYTREERILLQKAFGYSYGKLKDVILPMARNGAEPIAAMGTDTPLSVLSSRTKPLFSYFKQLFAQVTNPPLDAIREKVVTSTTVYVGKSGNLLEEAPENCHMLKIDNPILTDTDLLKIKNMNIEGFKVVTLPITYYVNTHLDRAIDHLFVEADRAYREGANVLILSDRGVDENHVAIPSLLAVSALQHYLVRTKKRTAVSIILESAEPREVHHFAALMGYGACAINPYMAHESIRELIDMHMLDKDYYAAVDDYNESVLKGIVKIASKMGISTIQSYLGSQIFEAVGISQDVIDKYFTGTVSRIGGITIKDIEKDINDMHARAFDPLGMDVDMSLDSTGYHKFRSHKEAHLYDPNTIFLLQQSTRTGDYELFKKYSDAVTDESRLMNLRSLLQFKFPEDGGIPIDEVESVDEIVTRFKTGAMSYGSISQEAHEALAIAMNTIHGRSNSGEGGESLDRLTVGADGYNRCSAIKQVASGRFGVTSRYLTSANEIQIKMAQGAKPGEGGHLPAGKVYPWIARTRLSTPGVALISPPPHHDIYSIEDLEQLIYDLKNANRRARISVKLCSEAGVGTVAAGVAKAGAQVILISGYDGGTGAAPMTSIHNAGLPWELGVAETHQTLLRNGLRSRVRIETDGKLMTGRDVAMAAILGAEEFGFATAPLVTLGCVMMRVCNLDTCPMGIATQNPELRKRFTGKPEYVINFMHFIAQELREIMARLGIRRLDDLVGRTDLIKMREDLDPELYGKLDLSAIINNPYADEEKHCFIPEDQYDFKLEKTIDERILLKEFKSALHNKRKKSVDIEVRNTDRTVGTILGSEITWKYPDGLADDTFTVRCKGSGGQSFGAFIPKGLTMTLEGDSNDYFGKGLSGGKLVLYPPKNIKFDPSENIIVGNVALYGATSGKAFISGVAGERFCVRNSGAYAVVEGVGDHGCEYMTGGRVVVLGKTGKNFAAGMSGGIAYVLDENSDLYRRLNKELILFDTVSSMADVTELRSMIQEHVEATGSQKGRRILENFSFYLPRFKKIIPRDYSNMQNSIFSMEAKGFTYDQAQIEAFYEMKKAQA